MCRTRKRSWLLLLLVLVGQLSAADSFSARLLPCLLSRASPRSKITRHRQTNDDQQEREPPSSPEAPVPLRSEDKPSVEEHASMEEQLNAFLDTEFFDPSKVKEGSPLKWFANLVENDYATAEALYTSFFIAFMVLVTQELVRMQLYGDRYVPF